MITYSQRQKHKANRSLRIFFSIVASIALVSGCSSSDEPTTDRPPTETDPNEIPVLVTAQTVYVTPLANGKTLIETNNGGIATAHWIAISSSESTIDAIESVTVSYNNGEPSFAVGIEDSVITSIIQEGGDGISFERNQDGSYIGRFTSPVGPRETFRLPALDESASASNFKFTQRANGDDSFYLETTCQGQRSYTGNTSISTSIYLTSSNERIYYSSFLERSNPGNGYYEINVPSNLSEEARDQYLADVKNDCNGIVVPIANLSWDLVEAVCATVAAVGTRNPRLVQFCFAVNNTLDPNDVQDLQSLLQDETSEGGLTITCGLLDLVLRPIPFDADIYVTASAWDPEFGSTGLIEKSYDSLNDLLNRLIELPFSDESQCGVEQWTLSGRCVGESRDAFVIEFPLQQNSVQSIAASGSGIDYDGSFLTTTLEALYSPSDRSIRSDIFFDDSDGGTRHDNFQASLATGETGYIGTTLINTNRAAACPVEVRLLQDAELVE